ncbi:MAG: energy-coupling factor transporter transmembrane protein EcfT [Corynebacterium sp.]|nr:energy-coupling factor transporter transmembrane protein EcfT [Corynebacterium sp.]
MKSLAMPLGVYVPGNTWVHRLAPKWKFLVLITLVLVSTLWLQQWYSSGVLVLAVVGLYASASIPLGIAWGQIWPVLPILALLGAFQWWRQDFPTAVTIIFSILAPLMTALLITLTTTLERMMDALSSGLEPTRRIGVPVDTIILAFSLTMRLIPLTFATVFEVMEARKARGLGFSMLALGSPVLIRSIRRARLLSEALWARGVGDDNAGENYGEDT